MEIRDGDELFKSSNVENRREGERGGVGEMILREGKVEEREKKKEEILHGKGKEK